MYLAELNIAVPKYPLDDPRIADFVNNLERVNSLAHKMPGFVWMHKDEAEGHAFALPTPFSSRGRDVAANLSVWETPEQFEHFVWNTIHKLFYTRKADWFDAMDTHHFVMWWVEEGHQPTLEEAKERLDHLNENGNSDFAFDWSHLPHIKLWQSQRCA